MLFSVPLWLEHAKHLIRGSKGLFTLLDCRHGSGGEQIAATNSGCSLVLSVQLGTLQASLLLEMTLCIQRKVSECTEVDKPPSAVILLPAIHA